MSGTVVGGKKASIKNKEFYGEDFYSRIGRKGGLLGRTGGFASQKVGADGLTGRERAKIAGSKGGKISKKNQYIKAKEDGVDGLLNHIEV